jgi:hypothetical protein
MEGSCEHGNESSGFIKRFGNSWVAAQLAASEKELVGKWWISGFYNSIESFDIWINVYSWGNFCATKFVIK